MAEPIRFKSHYFLRCLRGDYNPLTPNILTIDESQIEFKKRNWYLISSDTENLSFQKITGVSVDKHIFGATVTIKSAGNDSIYVSGFWKKKADEIKRICALQISANSHNGTSEALSDAISKAVGRKPDAAVSFSVADELIKLKGLVDAGVLTQEEFDAQKRKLIK